MVGRSDGQFLVQDLSNGSQVYEKNFECSISLLLTSKNGEDIILIPKKDDIIIMDSKSCMYFVLTIVLSTKINLHLLKVFNFDHALCMY